VGATGFTLVELVVVLAILGLVLMVSGVALTSVRPTPATDSSRALARARAEAIRAGRPVVVTHHAPRTTHIVFLPDGRAYGPGVDPLTGLPRGTP
jgi:prepilin-type N-terminal cleavage/methylation domain-containing protein